jgi:elongator complex protein 1
MMAYEKAHSWRPVFYLAEQSEMPREKVVELAYRVAGWSFVVLCCSRHLTGYPEDLSSRKRWTDAAAVYHDYASDIEETVRALTNDNELAEALRVVSPPHTGRSRILKPFIRRQGIAKWS